MNLKSQTTAFVALLALLQVAPGCKTAQRIPVRSVPAGARVLINSVDSGQTTPTELVLPIDEDRYEIRLEKPGYNPVSRELRLGTDVGVIAPGDLWVTCICSPCCLFIPLFGVLDELVTVERNFVPREIDVLLDLAGQGFKLESTPAEVEVFVDEFKQNPVEGRTYVTEPGSHELELRAPGYRPYRTAIFVEPRVYSQVVVQLEIEGEGLYLSAEPEGARIYLNDQFLGTLTPEPRRLRTAPGAHQLRVELEGYRVWEDVVQVSPGDYLEMHLPLQRAGQGLIVRRPAGVRAAVTEIEVRVDGRLQGTRFDDALLLEPGAHALEIRVPGFAAWHVTVQVTADQYLELTPGLQRK